MIGNTVIKNFKNCAEDIFFALGLFEILNMKGQLVPKTPVTSFLIGVAVITFIGFGLEFYSFVSKSKLSKLLNKACVGKSNKYIYDTTIGIIVMLIIATICEITIAL